ncbi:MAG: hypothetical protein EOO88_43500, partial [Pedobacter sp.]
MKKIRQYTTVMAMIVLTMLVVSCKKSFLEVTPKGRLIAQNLSDYAGLLNSLDLVNITGAAAQIPMGDEVAGIDPVDPGIVAAVGGTDPGVAGMNPVVAETDPAVAAIDPVVAETDPAVAGIDPVSPGTSRVEPDHASALVSEKSIPKK